MCGSVDPYCAFVLDLIDQCAQLLVFVLGARDVGVRLQEAIEPDVVDVKVLDPFCPHFSILCSDIFHVILYHLDVVSAQPLSNEVVERHGFLVGESNEAVGWS